MFQILVVDNGPLDRAIASDILSSGIRGVEVRTAESGAAALSVLQEKGADLLIADIPSSILPAQQLLTEARKICPSIAILITSIRREDQMPSLMLRLGAQHYLLKPFRPTQLLSSVDVLLHRPEKQSGSLSDQQQERYFARLSGAVKECAYKKCIEISKEYIDFLYGFTDNKEEIRGKTVSFAEGVAALGSDFSPELRWKLTGCLERFRSRYDLQGHRYETCAILEEMLDNIFEEMSHNAYYLGDDLKKVLNYIDRNIKRGVNLDDAAEYVNMSSCYFSKFFKKETGTNFITYVTERKIDYAKEMLRDTNMPVINIAYELSYNETNYFSKAFKKKVGITPTEYREQAGRFPTQTKTAVGS